MDLQGDLLERIEQKLENIRFLKQTMGSTGLTNRFIDECNPQDWELRLSLYRDMLKTQELIEFYKTSVGYSSMMDNEKKRVDGYLEEENRRIASMLNLFARHEEGRLAEM